MYVNETKKKKLYEQHPLNNCTSIVIVNKLYQLFQRETHKQKKNKNILKKENVYLHVVFRSVYLYNEDQLESTGWKPAWQWQDEYILTCLIAPG